MDITKDDWRAYDYCENHGGHIAACDIEGWFCLRCWIGFFMGLSFRVSKDVEEKIKLGNEYVLGQSGKDRVLFSKVYDNKYPFLPSVKRISYADAIKLGPNVIPHKDGGPPHIFTLKTPHPRVKNFFKSLTKLLIGTFRK